MKNLFLTIVLALTAVTVSAQSDATIEETIEFIEAKINNAQWLDFIGHPEGCDMGDVVLASKKVTIDPSTVGVIKLQVSERFNSSATWEDWYEAKLSDLSSEIRIRDKDDCKYGPYAFIISSAEGEKITNIFAPNTKDQKVRMQSEIRIWAFKEDSENLYRLKKALSHLITLSGGVEEKF